MRKRLMHVNLQILYQCNFKCDICDFWKPPFTTMPKMSLDDVKIIAKKLKPLGPHLINIGGGEPLLHPDIIEIIRVLARDNFPVMICNGWFVTPETAHALYEAGLYEVSISVDYASAEKHDKQRNMPGAYDKALNALRTLFENRVRPRQRSHMISVLMEDNLEDVEDLIKLSRTLGVTYMNTFYSDSRGRKEANLRPAEISRRLLELKRRYPEFVTLPAYLARYAEAEKNGHGVGPCYAGRSLYNIDCCGQVTRCIDHLHDPVGNILTDDMEKIAAGLYGQYLTQDCHNCWTSCRGIAEVMIYDKHRISNLAAFYQMTKGVPLVKSAC
jgi:MoaA/NifB/PqqE/SkfB family radical SAM enzyme